MKFKIFERRSRRKELPESSTGLDLSRFGLGFAPSSEALSNSALWSCVNNLARQYATLPLHPYQPGKGGVDVRMPEDSLLQELLYNPNPGMTGYVFRYVMGIYFELYGQASAVIERHQRTGKPLFLWPLPPSTLIGHWDNGQLFYRVTVTGVDYPAKDLLILDNTPLGNGRVLSPIKYAHDDLELARMCKKMQAEYYNGSSIIGNLITVPEKYTEEQLDKVKTRFDSARGFNNFVVRESVKVEPLRVNSGDIDKLNSAQAWNTKEVCRRFQVPPFIAGETGDKYNSNEQQQLIFVTTCLRPRCKAWAAAFTASLCTPGHKIKFDLGGLLEGDTATRQAYYTAAIQYGWMTINEVRKKENLPPVPFGDTPMINMTLGSLENVVQGKYLPQPQNVDPWNVPDDSSDKEENKTPDQEILDEKAHEKLFIEAASEPALNGRRKLEKLIKAQLASEIAELKSLIASGSPTNQVLKDWKEWLDIHAKDTQESYRNLYVDILKKMIPVVKKEVETDQEVTETDYDDFINGYSEAMSKRQACTAYDAAKDLVGSEDFDTEIDDTVQTVAVEESHQETLRSRGAFTHFLYGVLGVTYMKVVTGGDACAFCSKLDGRTVEVKGTILQKGTDETDADGTVVHINKSYKHPPFHKSCNCFVVPVKQKK